MIVELMRAGGPDLARRWIGALLAAPEAEREAIVESVEARIAELYLASSEDATLASGGADGEVTVRLKARRKTPSAD